MLDASAGCSTIRIFILVPVDNSRRVPWYIHALLLTTMFMLKANLATATFSVMLWTLGGQALA
jgi:hypothetical protein